jgi:amino acid adenylation domain-containing protein
MDIIHSLRESFEQYANRPALIAGKEALTYGQLAVRVYPLAGFLQERRAAEPLIGFLCHRDRGAYEAVLAILLAGKAYVPLNPKLPLDRLQRICALAGLTTVLVGERSEELAGKLQTPSRELTFVAMSDAAVTRGPEWTATPSWMESARPPFAVEHSADRTAYLLFTSGSTGEPKGVPVSYGNLGAYTEFVNRTYRYGPSDIHSQTFELTFDLSVHDMICTWTTGGCLVRFSGAELMSPAAVIARNRVTCWFSVPSLGSMMLESGVLRSAALPSLRVSLFCGEALPASLAAAWSEAAPASILENLYGPTEATIAITRYRWRRDESPAHCRRGLVPIGHAFEGQTAMVVDDAGRVQAGESRGLLHLSGSQVTGCYWRSPGATAVKYRAIDGISFYNAGDIVERDSTGCLHFVGRSDSEIKLRGYRIDLQEVEDALRVASHTDFAVVLPWPVRNHAVHGLVAVVAAKGLDTREVDARMRQRLPVYMIPDKILLVDSLPRNLSGKIDRKALGYLLALSTDSASV